MNKQKFISEYKQMDLSALKKSDKNISLDGTTLAEDIEEIYKDTENAPADFEFSKNEGEVLTDFFTGAKREIPEAFGAKPKETKSKKESPEITEWKDAVETLTMLIDAKTGTDAEISEWQDAVDTLKMLLNQ